MLRVIITVTSDGNALPYFYLISATIAITVIVDQKKKKNYLIPRFEHVIDRDLFFKLPSPYKVVSEL